MNTRHACFKTILTMSVVLLVGCSSGNNGNGNQPDTTSPVITLTGDNPQVIAVGEAYAELGATANDNRDGDLTSSIVINASTIDSAVPGTYQVTYDVSDAAGNAATTVTRTVTYEDRTSPVISLVGDDPLVHTFGSVYIDPGATASDNVDGDISVSITIDASGVDTSTPGDYLVTYNVTDAAGNAATEVTRTVTVPLPVPAEATVTVFGDIKTLNFSWSEPEYVDHYRLMENADGHSGFTQVGDDIPAGTLTAERDIAVHLFDWVNAQYVVEACNVMGCSSSDVVTATDVMLDTIGYLKASNTGAFDRFGRNVALSADGTTLAVGSGSVYLFRFDGTSWAEQAHINAGGRAVALSANGNTLAVGPHLFRFDGVSWAEQAHINASSTGGQVQLGQAVALSADGDTLAITSWEVDRAAYLFRFDGTSWVQQAYFNPPNTPGYYEFGNALALSADGDTLAVASQGDEWAGKKSGAVYLFQFDGLSWAQQAFIKGSAAASQEYFGSRLALSADGATLAVIGAGAYLFRYDGASWAEQARIDASNTVSFSVVALSADGSTLVVSAWSEDSGATGINGDQADNSARDAGAVYLFGFDGTSWAQQAYIKAPNTEENDWFGRALALSADGATLAVGAYGEDSSATGINGDQTDNSAEQAGAVYVY